MELLSKLPTVLKYKVKTIIVEGKVIKSYPDKNFNKSKVEIEVLKSHFVDILIEENGKMEIYTNQSNKEDIESLIENTDKEITKNIIIFTP